MPLRVTLFLFLLACGVAENTAGPSNAYLSITVYKGVPDVQGKSFTVSASTTNLGYAQDCPSISGCSPAEEARVSFGLLAADSTIEVTYRLEFSDRTRTGQVRPRLLPAPGLCG